MSVEQRLIELADKTLRDAAWKTEIRKIAEEVRMIEARIQRLEEAGDTMASAYRQICYDAYDDQQIDNWIKAKDEKP